MAVRPAGLVLLLAASFLIGIMVRDSVGVDAVAVASAPQQTQATEASSALLEAEQPAAPPKPAVANAVADPPAEDLLSVERESAPKLEASIALDQALSGDQHSIDDLLRRLIECRGSSQLLLQTADQIERLSAATPNVFSTERAEEAIIAADEDNRRCQDFFGDAEQMSRLRAKIKDASALADNAVARFLYTLSVPTEVQDVAAFEADAKRFTDINRDAAPELWLAALGLSYSTGEQFTPRRPSLGTVFLRAAQLCGVELPFINRQIVLNQRYGDFPTLGRQTDNWVPLIPAGAARAALAEELADAHCF